MFILSLWMERGDYCLAIITPCFPSLSAGIGAWQTVFEVMGYLAIVTNCALVGLYAHKADLIPTFSNIQLLLLIVALEVSCCGQQ